MPECEVELDREATVSINKSHMLQVNTPTLKLILMSERVLKPQYRFHSWRFGRLLGTFEPLGVPETRKERLLHCTGGTIRNFDAMIDCTPFIMVSS